MITRREDHCFCTIRLVRTRHPHCCSLVSTRSCWLCMSRLHICITLCDDLHGLLLAFLRSLSLAFFWLCRFSMRFVRSSRLTPPRSPCSSARLPVLGALCCFLQRHIPHSLVCGDPPSVSWFEHPTEGYDSRDRSLWPLCGSCLVDHACLMLSRHPSLCSLTSALICAVLHTSLESPPAGYTREYASCALRETTLCASRKSSVHHCLSLKVFSSTGLHRRVVRWGLQHHQCGCCSR